MPCGGGERGELVFPLIRYKEPYEVDHRHRRPTVSNSSLFKWRAFEADIIICAIQVVSAVCGELSRCGKTAAGTRCVG
jgi:hypothetical protein